MNFERHITNAYWFTSSTSFADSAVATARGFSDALAGIAPRDVWAFIAAQLVVAIPVKLFFSWLFVEDSPNPVEVT